jgi:photosystem II stability/assembly factor-like uncharacterized protein
MKNIRTSEAISESKFWFLIQGERIYHYFAILLFIFTPLLNAQSINFSHHQWQLANGHYEASLNSISFDPVNPEIMYSGGKGAFRSENEGELWIDITPDTILSGGGEHSLIKTDPNNSGIVYYGAGALFKSYNYGENWEIIGFQNKSISSIDIDPANSEIIYVGLGNTTNNSIWKSTNGGETWAVKSSGIGSSLLPTQICKGIKINPMNSNSLVASVRGKGIYKSIDGADNWVSIWGNSAVNDVEVLSWDTTTILVSSGTLFKSTNEGLNWIQISDVNASCIEVDNITHEIYYGFHRTSDMGVTWDSLINPNLPTSFSLAININDIRIKSGDNNILFAATDAGIYKSTNKGLFWNQSFEGLNRFRPFDVKISLSNPLIYYSTGIQGIHRSEEAGKTWKYVGGVVTQNLVAIHPKNPDVVFNAQMPNITVFSLWRTFSKGQNWDYILTSSRRFIAIEFDPENFNTIYAISHSLHKSTDLGDTWQIISVPTGPYSLQINPKDNSEFYLGTREGVFKSTDGGLNWNYLGLPAGYNITVLISPYNLNTLYASVYDIGFFKSADAGKTWEERNNGLSSYKFTQLKVNPKIPDQVFIGTEDDGIYHSNNSGSTWYKLEPPFPAQYINAIAIDTIGTGRLLAASMNVNGVYFLDSISTITSLEYEENDIPKDFKLYQNYPNPFNPATTIEFSITQREKLIIEIYDLLGQRVRVLLDEEMEKGQYKINFNANGLPSGIYFYNINNGRSSITKKMVIVR